MEETVDAGDNPLWKFVRAKSAEVNTAYICYLPINVAMETIVSGMTDWESLKSRLGGFGITYALLPPLMWGRKKIKKGLNADVGSSRKKKTLIDSIFAASLSAPVRAGIYWWSCESNVEKILLGTLTTTVAAAVLAPPVLYAAEVVTESLGLTPYENTPNWLREKSISYKRKLFAGIAVASLALAAMIYAVTPNDGESPEKYLHSVDEQIEAISVDDLENRIIDEHICPFLSREIAFSLQ